MSSRRQGLVHVAPPLAWISLLAVIVAPRIARGEAAVELHYLQTRETLVIGRHIPAPTVLNRFFRCPKDRRYTLMDPRLVVAAAGAARRFGVVRVNIVSAFRTTRLNEELRSRGYRVALRSRHANGQALDVQLPGVTTEALCEHFRALRLGGVGCYPRLGFVHVDVGPVRHWTP